MTGEISSAERLYRQFREAAPSSARRVRVRIPKALARMGTCEFVGYLTTHKGKAALYVHYFAPGSRPGLYANTGRGQLFLIGGRFRVSERGITDQDIRGRDIDYTPRYRTITEKEYQELVRFRRKFTPGDYRVAARLNRRLTNR